MKLNELYGIKSHLSSQTMANFDTVRKHMESLGFKFVDSGAYGIVFEKPSLEYVLKIIKDDDPCYRAFVDYCKKNSKNPHLPKIYGTYIPLQGYGYLIRIEKLKPVPLDLFKSSGLSDFLFIVDNYGINNNDPNQEAVLLSFQKKNKLFANTVYDLVKRSEAGECMIDFGYSNVMMRGKTLVILDPWG